MKILKTFLLVSLFLCTWNAKTFAENNQSWWQIFIGVFSPSDNKNDSQQLPAHHNQNSSNSNNNYVHPKEVDYGRVRQEFRSAFDNTFATSYQTQVDQDELKKIREKSSNEVIHRLQTQFGNYSEAQAKLKAREFARSAALEFVGEKTAEIVNDEITRIRRNPPINPEHLKPVYRDQLVNYLKQEMLREARNRVSSNNEYGSLREYAGEQLRRKISPKVEKAFGVSPDQQPAGQHIHEGIIEIYPKNAGAHMKVFRDEICCSCQDEFTEIGKRVILQCGHTICPACIYQWLYVQKKNTCPHCRATINTAEFPANYLRQYM